MNKSLQPTGLQIWVMIYLLTLDFIIVNLDLLPHYLLGSNNVSEIVCDLEGTEFS
jgi:hypothetical protein